MEDDEGGPRLSKRFSDKDGGEVDFKTEAGTAWSHNFLNQKPWHPLSYPNQRRKWIAEQTHSQRHRRAEEIAREVSLRTHLSFSFSVFFTFFYSFFSIFFAVFSRAGISPADFPSLSERERKGQISIFCNFIYHLGIFNNMNLIMILR